MGEHKHNPVAIAAKNGEILKKVNLVDFIKEPVSLTVYSGEDEKLVNDLYNRIVEKTAGNKPIDVNMHGCVGSIRVSGVDLARSDDEGFENPRYTLKLEGVMV